MIFRVCFQEKLLKRSYETTYLLRFHPGHVCPRNTYSRRRRDFPTDNFRRFLSLPAELREIIIHQYVLTETALGTLKRRQHLQYFNEACCIWKYPAVLIACNSSRVHRYDPWTGRMPWLPPLGLTSKSMHRELTLVMLRNTERFVFKFKCTSGKVFDVVDWFRKFLVSFPDDPSISGYIWSTIHGAHQTPHPQTFS